MSVFSKVLPSPITSLKWDGSLILLGDQDGSLSLWDVVEVRQLFQMTAHDGEYQSNWELPSDNCYFVYHSNSNHLLFKNYFCITSFCYLCLPLSKFSTEF